MKKMLILLISSVLFSRIVQPVAAQSPVITSLPAATVSAQTFDNGPHFLAGENVVLSQDVIGDVFAAGGQVRVESKIDGDLFVAGGQVVITGEVTGDVVGAAGTVELRGEVNEDVTIAAGNVTLDRMARVKGNVVIGAGNADLFGSVGKNVWLGAGSSILGGQFGQDVKVYGNSTQFLPMATIRGGLSTKLEASPSVAPDASIAGERKIEVIEKTSEAEKSQGPNWLLIVTSLLTALVLGGLAQPVLRSPLIAIGWGLVFLILLPIMAVVICITIIGIPIAVFLMFIYVVGLVVAHWVTAFALGKAVLKSVGYISNSWTVRLLQLGVGLLASQVLMAVPILGWIVRLAALLLGLGALTMMLVNQVRGGDSLPVGVSPMPTKKQRSEKANIVESPVRRRLKTSTKNRKPITRRSKKQK